MDRLEDRLLLSAAVPSDYDQYMLELINRARANPAAEAALDKIDLNEGVPADATISTSPKQPLAFNPYLIDAARGHSQDMITHDYFGHDSYTGQTGDERMVASGYVFDNSQGWGSGENIAWRGSSPAVPPLVPTTAQLDQDLFVDAGYDGRGHRINMLYPDFKEIGVGVVAGLYYDPGHDIDYHAVMGTIDFAYDANTVFLTGVAFHDDTVVDRFYEPGEGIGGLTITAVRNSDNASFSATTFSSGGYTIPMEPGTYTVTASGAGLNAPLVVQNVVIGQDNVKVDFIKPQPVSGTPVDKTPPAAKFTGSKLVTTAARSYQFTVTYTDPSKVRRSTVGAGDILVTGPKSFKATRPSFVSTKTKVDATTIAAVYAFVPPGGKWTTALNGTYTVTLNAKHVSDARGNASATGLVLAKFVVSLKKSTVKVSAAPLANLWLTGYPSAGLFAGNPIRRATSDIF